MRGKILRGIIENKIGEEILKRCQDRRYAKFEPTMIPPIPVSTFIDMLPEGVLEGQNVQEKEHQNSYEAEVKLYRCLEELKKNYLVIHQLKNTHEQYCAFVGKHSCNKIGCREGPNDHPCHKKPRAIEGECDFVVAGDNFVAIFEVKWDEDGRMFISSCEKALMQRRRMRELLKSIDPTVIVFEFTVFPDVSIDEITECLLKDETIIFFEDLQYITSIIGSCEEFSYLLNATESSRDKLYRCLTGLWCIDQENKWDFSSCELTKCIKDIDQKLSKALVTRKAVDSEKSKRGENTGKKYPENPEMVEAPDLFKKYLKINCLTQDQLDVFECKDRFLWVEGPAGSGKTIAMLGKIIDIVLNNDTENVLVISIGWKTSPAVQRYHEVLNKISEDISCSIEQYAILIEELSDIEDRANVTTAERSSLQQINNSSNRIVILALNFTLIASINTCDIITSRFDYVFVDDYHSFNDHVASEAPNLSYTFNMLSDGLLPVIENYSTNNTSLWVFSDIGQSLRIFDTATFSTELEVRGELNEFKDNFVSQKLLSVNLRNTHEISSVLSVIRKHYNAMEFSGTGTLGLNQPKNGHFLRGTKPTIYLLGDDPAACEGILEKELCKLRGPDSCLEDKDIAVLYDGHQKYRKELQEMAENLLRMRNRDIAVQYTNDCRSAEWPAVVYLHRLTTVKIPYTQSDNSVKEITFSYTIPLLYQALCRGRVYSTVIIYNYKPNACEYTDKMLSELKGRTDICRIVDL